MEAVAGGAGEAETCSPRLHGSPCPPALVTGQGAVRICRAVGGSGPDVELARRASSTTRPCRIAARRHPRRERGGGATGRRYARAPAAWRAQIQVQTRHARGSPPRCAAAPALRLFQPRSVGSIGRVGTDARPRQRCACFSGGSSGVGRAGARRQAAELPRATPATTGRRSRLPPGDFVVPPPPLLAVITTGRRSRLPPGDPDSWRRPESAPLRRGGLTKRIIRLLRAKCCEARNTLLPGRGH